MGSLTDAEWSPDGKTLIVITDRDLQIVDAESLEILHSDQGYEFVQFLQDGNLLLQDQQGLPVILDMQSYELNLIDAEIPSNVYAISSDGKVIADVSTENKIKIINIESGESTEFVYYLKDYAKVRPLAVTFSPDQKYLYVSNSISVLLSELLVFDLEKQQLLSQHPGINGIPKFTPDNKRLVFKTSKYVSLFTSIMGPWSNHALRFSSSLNDEENIYYNEISYSFIQDSSRIGVLYQGRIANRVKDEQRFTATIIIYNTDKGTVERFINDIPAASFDLGFSPDGSRFFTLSKEGYIQIWRASDGELFLTSQAYKPNTNVAVSPDGNLFAYSIGDNVRIVNRSDGEIIAEINDSKSSLGSYVTFQGNDIIAISSNDRIDTYDITTGEWIRSYPELANCDFNHSGTTMICASSNLNLFDAKTGTTLLQIKSSWGQYQYAVSDDGAYAAYCTDNSETVFLYDLKKGTQFQFLRMSDNQAACGSLDFSADGQFLVSSTGAVWQIQNGELILEIPIVIRNVYWTDPMVSIARNNEFVLIYPNIYNLSDGSLLAEIDAHGEQITNVWFHPDGFLLFLLSENTLQSWGVLE